jgi:hypothetical protein
LKSEQSLHAPSGTDDWAGYASSKAFCEFQISISVCSFKSPIIKCSFPYNSSQIVTLPSGSTTRELRLAVQIALSEKLEILFVSLLSLGSTFGPLKNIPLSGNSTFI